MNIKKFFLIAAVALMSLGMQSCLQYDEPGDEFEQGQIKPDTDDDSSSSSVTPTVTDVPNK